MRHEGMREEEEKEGEEEEAEEKKDEVPSLPFPSGRTRGRGGR